MQLLTARFKIDTNWCMLALDKMSWYIYSCVRNHSTFHAFSRLISIVNKLCNIECCVNNMFWINKKIIVSQGLELTLSVFRGTTISDQHPLTQVWVQNFQNYSAPCSHWNIMGAGGWIILKILDPYLNQRMLIWYSSPSKHT